MAIGAWARQGALYSRTVGPSLGIGAGPGTCGAARSLALEQLAGGWLLRITNLPPSCREFRRCMVTSSGTVAMDF